MSHFASSSRENMKDIHTLNMVDVEKGKILAKLIENTSKSFSIDLISWYIHALKLVFTFFFIIESF